LEIILEDYDPKIELVSILSNTCNKIIAVQTIAPFRF
jgi:hypothetical protein